jgi:hypothetical protein
MMLAFYISRQYVLPPITERRKPSSSQGTSRVQFSDMRIMTTNDD